MTTPPPDTHTTPDPGEPSTGTPSSHSLPPKEGNLPLYSTEETPVEEPSATLPPPLGELLEGVFLGLFFPGAVTQQIAALQHLLAEHLGEEVSREIAWVPPTWFFLPIHYVGTLPSALLEVITDIAERHTRETPFLTLETQGVKTLHDEEGAPRVLYLSFSSLPLEQLGAQISNSLERVGLPSTQNRAPLHITLGRVTKKGLPPIMGKIEAFAASLPDSFTSNHLVVGSYGEEGLEGPPVIHASVLLEKRTRGACCQRLPALLPYDEDSEKLLTAIVEATGVDLEETLARIDREANASSLFTPSVSTERDPQDSVVPASAVQTSLRGDSPEYEPPKGGRSRKRGEKEGYSTKQRGRKAHPERTRKQEGARERAPQKPYPMPQREGEPKPSLQGERRSTPERGPLSPTAPPQENTTDPKGE